MLYRLQRRWHHLSTSVYSLTVQWTMKSVYFSNSWRLKVLHAQNLQFWQTAFNEKWKQEMWKLPLCPPWDLVVMFTHILLFFFIFYNLFLG